MKKKHTQRGFPYYQFKDKYNQSCSLQLSSLADDRCIWLGVDDAHPTVLASQASLVGIKTQETTGWVDYPIPEQVQLQTRMHLNTKQVAKLLPILQKFVETGDL